VPPTHLIHAARGRSLAAPGAAALSAGQVVPLGIRDEPAGEQATPVGRTYYLGAARLEQVVRLGHGVGADLRERVGLAG
jgi:hypothetical protein